MNSNDETKSIFEKIINNEINCLKVYEDDNFIAILDIKPKQKGHTLLIPKLKRENILNESEYVLENILKIGNKIANQLKTKLNASGIKMIMNNGKSAGQEVFHTHLHIIPYYKNEEKKLNNKEILDLILN